MYYTLYLSLSLPLSLSVYIHIYTYVYVYVYIYIYIYIYISVCRRIGSDAGALGFESQTGRVRGKSTPCLWRDTPSPPIKSFPSKSP